MSGNWRNLETWIVFSNVAKDWETDWDELIVAWRQMHGAAAAEHLAHQLRLDYDEWLGEGWGEQDTLLEQFCRRGLRRVDWLQVAQQLLEHGHFSARRSLSRWRNLETLVVFEELFSEWKGQLQDLADAWSGGEADGDRGGDRGSQDSTAAAGVARSSEPLGIAGRRRSSAEAAEKLRQDYTEAHAQGGGLGGRLVRCSLRRVDWLGVAERVLAASPAKKGGA